MEGICFFIPREGQSKTVQEKHPPNTKCEMLHDFEQMVEA